MGSRSPLVVLWLGTLRGNREPGSVWRSGGRRALLLGLVPGVAIGLARPVRAQCRATTGLQREPVLQLTAVTAAVILVGLLLARPPVARRVRALWERHRTASRPAAWRWSCSPPRSPSRSRSLRTDRTPR